MSLLRGNARTGKLETFLPESLPPIEDSTSKIQTKIEWCFINAFLSLQVYHSAADDPGDRAGNVCPRVTRGGSQVCQGGRNLLPQRHTISTDLAGIF